MDGETDRAKQFTKINTVIVLRTQLTPEISTEINLDSL